MEVLLNASNVLQRGKIEKEVKNDLLSKMAPPIIQSCNLIDCYSIEATIEAPIIVKRILSATLTPTPHNADLPADFALIG
jgi:hypothetical protein